jgi:hypothetical protein
MRPLFVVALLAVVVVGCGSPNTPVPASPRASTPLTSSSPGIVASEVPSTAPATPAPSRKPTPAATPNPTSKPIALCLAKQLAAKVTGWNGAAGSQIATVRVTNTSATTCTVRGTPEVELVGANGAILIDSQTDGSGGLPHVSPGAPAYHLAHNGHLTTQVIASNYCGAPPALPTTVAFVLPSNAGRLVAAPGPGGSTPPCNGAPGSLGSTSMNGWTR